MAPVRETCAQALGVVLSHMTTEDVQGVMSVLLKLQEQPQWETRHGGLLGLKYLLAVRQVIRCFSCFVLKFLWQGLFVSLYAIMSSKYTELFLAMSSGKEKHIRFRGDDF